MISSGFQKLTCRGVQNARLLKTLGTVSIRPPSKQNSRCVVGKRSYSQTRLAPANTVRITYVDPDGDETTVDADIGQNLLHVAHDNDIELEGACGAELACSTCHLIFEKEIFDKLPEMEEEEEDMLDLAFEVTETSRLGCQILVREDFDGMKVRIPDDGF